MGLEKVLTADVLTEEYVYLNKKPSEIAKEYGCKPYNVIYYLKKYNMYIKQQRKPKINYKNITREYLYELYVVKQLSQKEIAGILGVQNIKGVRQKLREYKIPIRIARRKLIWEPYEEIPGPFWQSVVNGAKRRKIEFNLTIEDAWDLFIRQDRKCALSGIKIKFERYAFVRESGKSRWNQNQTASLDRIDSTLGYIKGNVQWVHKDINLMKSDLNQEQFIKYCRLIASHYEI